MNFFGLTKAASALAARSRTVRRVASQQVRQGKRGILPGVFSTAGHIAKKQSKR